jgi:glycerol-3-phosphate acyltransferase PlsY
MIAAGICITVAVIAYLLGSIPFGYLLVRIFRKQDIRATGSGNIGATNVVRSGAKGLGALTFLLDGAKGYVAVFAAGWLLGDRFTGPNVYALAAFFAVIGHMHPIWLRFKGGKGVATALGVFLALSPIAALIGLGVFVVVFALWRYVSLASIVAAVVFPIVALVLARDRLTPLFVAMVILIPALVIIKHRQNIVRLLNGTEYRFGKAKTESAAKP